MKIAICDDLKSERDKTKDALSSVVKSFTVEEFDDGYELLKHHAASAYDLIILDILMPKIDGMQIAELLRKYDSKTPIVFLSASDEFGVQSYRVAAFDYLLKPINQEHLKLCIKRLLSQNKKITLFV